MLKILSTVFLAWPLWWVTPTNYAHHNSHVKHIADKIVNIKRDSNSAASQYLPLPSLSEGSIPIMQQVLYLILLWWSGTTFGLLYRGATSHKPLQHSAAITTTSQLLRHIMTHHYAPVVAVLLPSSRSSLMSAFLYDLAHV